MKEANTALSSWSLLSKTSVPTLQKALQQLMAIFQRKPSMVVNAYNLSTWEAGSRRITNSRPA
jgi:hypothetical protein